MNQHANASNRPITPVVETPIPPSQVEPPVHISAPEGVPHVNLHPLVVEIDDHHDAFFSPRASSQYEAFVPATNEL